MGARWILVCMAAVGLLGAATAHARDAEVAVDASKTFQTIEGFGTCVLMWQDLPEYKRAEFFDLAVNDLGISMMRVPVPPQTMEPVNDNDDPDEINWAAFNMYEMDRRMKVLLEFKKRGVKRFMASLWSPPEYMKTNRFVRWGGHLRADMREEFAEYMAAFVMASKKNWGIDINWLSPQNELMFVHYYDSCVYNGEQVREVVRAMMRKFKKENIATRILIPEHMMRPAQMLAYIRPTMADPETRDFPGDFCTHRQGGFEGWRELVRDTEVYGRQLWMTETSGHKNDWTGAMILAQNIYEALVGGNCSAWLYWQISRRGAALMVDGRPAPLYYASKHYYRYIRPGALRIDAASSDPNVLVSAFKHPANGTMTVVLVNKGDDEAAVTIGFRGGPAPASFRVYRSGAEENCVDAGDLALDGAVLRMPARSIVTLQGQAEAIKTLSAPVLLPAAWKVPDGTGDGRWGDFNKLDRGKAAGICRGAELGNDGWVNRELNNVDINDGQYNGWTALHMAILAGKADTVKMLLEKGADVNRAANDGWTPIHAAAGCYWPNKYTIFKLVMARNPDVKARTKDGWTPLHSAAANAHVAFRHNPADDTNRIKELLAAGADVDAKDVNGRTPLHWAAWMGYTRGLSHRGEVAAALIRAGADVNARDRLGRTPLHYAAEQGHDLIVAELLKAKADARRPDGAGKTPAQLARARGLARTVDLLEAGDAGAATDAGGEERPVAGRRGPELMRAARAGDVAKVKELLAAGADLHYEDGDGFRAVDRARDAGREEVVRLLKEAEARQRK